MLGGISGSTKSFLLLLLLLALVLLDELPNLGRTYVREFVPALSVITFVVVLTFYLASVAVAFASVFALYLPLVASLFASFVVLLPSVLLLVLSSLELLESHLPHWLISPYRSFTAYN